MKESLYGFKLQQIKESPETGSTAYYYLYEKTNTPLLFLKNSEKNMTFGVGFRTPPEDSTGVAHIVEHAVLSGSKKFKSREPFMELIKSSLQTFLNAMTFSDMTLYPVSSKNNKDFYNLTNVYMDSVFNPIMHENPFIFMQEGWHHELLNKEDPIRYKGVVYNEMRGAYSSPERQVEHQIISKLHPNSSYAHESGGYPFDIPKLTYEAFKSFHKQYYHPSNALLFLFGDVNEEAIFPLLQSYLEEFEAIDPHSEIKRGNKLPAPQEASFKFNSDETQKPENNSFLSYVTALGDASDPKLSLSHEILEEMLIHSESSPLKKALRQANLGESFLTIDSDSAFLDFGLLAKNVDAKRLQEFKELIDSELQKLVDNGIDKDLIEASINKVELRLREAQGSYRGVIFFIKAMSAKRYDIDPLSFINFLASLEEIKMLSKEGYFEKIIKKNILENSQKIIASHLPDEDYFKELDVKATQELKAYKESLSDKELDFLIENNKALLAFQSTEETEEEKATIPRLSLDDVPDSLDMIEETKVHESGITYLLYPQNTSGLCYLYFAFDENHLKEEEWVHLSYLAKLLGILSTTKHEYSDLNNDILKISGGLTIKPFVHYDRDETASLRLSVSTKTTARKLDSLLLLLEEVFTETCFEAKRIKEILQMVKSNLEMGFNQQGHLVAVERVNSFYSEASYMKQYLNGISFYDHLSELLAHWEERSSTFIDELKSLYERILKKDKLIVAITAEQSSLDGVLEKMSDLSRLFDDKNYEHVHSVFKEGIRREAITAPYNVQYISKGMNFKDFGYSYHGSMTVLSRLLSNDYLHTAIRAKGGAYGTGIILERQGNMASYSYRDPNLLETINTYDGISDYLRTINLSTQDLSNIVIGSIGKFDPPMSPSEIGPIMLSRYLSGLTHEMREHLLQEAKNTTLEDLKGYAELFDIMKKENYLFALGNKDKLRESKEIFEKIRPLSL